MIFEGAKIQGPEWEESLALQQQLYHLDYQVLHTLPGNLQEYLQITRKKPKTKQRPVIVINLC